MSAPRTLDEVTHLEQTLREQWLALRGWVGRLDADAVAMPSVLAGWTVAELVAHLGRAMDALGAAQPTPPGTVPVTLAEYVGGYPERAQAIADFTRELAVEIADDPLASVDRMTEASFAQLGVLRGLGVDPVVQARRAPILLSEMMLSRLIELVVHADDLLRSTRGAPALTGGAPGPLLPAAVTLVSDALLEIAVDRGGWEVEVIDELAWIRLACGRVPYSVESLAAALRPAHTAGGLPDLGNQLPLL